MAEDLTVFIRVPLQRGDFVDPPVIRWDNSKDEMLWKILPGVAKAEIEWNQVAERFGVPVDFILQQVGYLTHHVSQVHAQVCKAAAVVNRTTTSMSESIRREPIAGGPPSPPAASATPVNAASPADAAPPQEIIATATDVHTDAGVATAVTGLASESIHSPSSLNDGSPSSHSPDNSNNNSSDDESSPAQSRIIRRPPRDENDKFNHSGDDDYNDDDDEDEEEPAFQPIRKTNLESTLRGGLKRRGEASQTSADSDISFVSRGGQQGKRGHLGALSPRRSMTAGVMDAAAAARGRPGRIYSREGSDGTPSMGSSYSDLEDTSVTQSALEEALASHMDQPGASRFSISQTIRSRYLHGGKP